MTKWREKLFLPLLLVVLAYLLFTRFSYCHVPFERDEGEYAYAGSLILQGHHPYSEAYNMKFPGTYFMYALMMKVGGESIEAVRLGVCIIVILTAFLLGCIVWLLTGNLNASSVAVVAYVALTNTMGVEGLMANAEHFVNLFAVSGIFLLLIFFRRYRKLYLLFTSGFLLGCSVMMKQYGYAFCLFGFALLLVEYFRKPFGEALKAHLLFVAGGLLPALVLLSWLITNGLWVKFRFLTLDYALAYLKYYPSDYFIVTPQTAHIIALTVLASQILLFIVRRRKDDRVLIGWFIFSIFAVCTGCIFRRHYFLLLYPAAAAGIAYIYYQVDGKYRFQAIAANSIIILSLSSFFVTQKEDEFPVSPLRVFEDHYSAGYFQDMPLIANQINRLIPAGDKLSMFSYEPELYFYSHRISASGYIYSYPLFEPQPYAHQMTDEYIREVEANHSRLFAFEAPAKVFDDTAYQYFANWWTRYSKNFYLKGLYYRTSDSTGTFIWDETLNTDSTWKNSHRIEFWMRKDQTAMSKADMPLLRGN